MLKIGIGKGCHKSMTADCTYCACRMCALQGSVCSCHKSLLKQLILVICTSIGITSKRGNCKMGWQYQKYTRVAGIMKSMSNLFNGQYLKEYFLFVCFLLPPSTLHPTISLLCYGSFVMLRLSFTYIGFKYKKLNETNFKF